MDRCTVSIVMVSFCIVLVGAGCCRVTETVKGIAGISTKVLEDNRAAAVKRSYPVAYAQCIAMVEEFLVEKEAYIYNRNESKKMIALYVSESDTTPVGIFFTPLADASTEVAVSSPSRHAKESFADQISAWFEKKKRSEQTQSGSGVSGGAGDQGNRT